ncbi:MAG: hypothetical protein AAFQ02_03345 [Bacteroidota bacterium]
MNKCHTSYQGCGWTVLQFLICRITDVVWRVWVNVKPDRVANRSNGKVDKSSSDDPLHHGHHHPARSTTSAYISLLIQVFLVIIGIGLAVYHLLLS